MPHQGDSVQSWCRRRERSLACGEPVKGEVGRKTRSCKKTKSDQVDCHPRQFCSPSRRLAQRSTNLRSRSINSAYGGGMESRNYDSDGRDGRRRRSDSPPSPRPQRDLPPHLARRDAHLEEGRKGSMVKGDDGVTRWQRRASPDYDRGRDGDRRDPPPERPAEGYARSNGYPRDNGYPERRQDYAGGDGRQGGYRQQGPGYAPGGRNDFFEQCVA